MSLQQRSVIVNALFVFVLFLSGCGGESILGGRSSASSPVDFTLLIAIRNSAPIGSCPAGGISVDTGRDQNGTGILEVFEVTDTLYVCNGEVGTDGINGLGALASITYEPSGTNCATDGTQISVGQDANRDGILDPGEITSTSYVCNGATGATGATGADALSTLIAFIAEPPSANCAYGGNRTTSGLDTNANDILDLAEVTSTTYVCNGATGATGATGANGTNGLSTLIAFIAEPPSANCTYGGNRTTSGLDANADDILDLAEVTSTTYVCNGATGATGATGADGTNGANGLNTLIAIIAEPPSANCTYGGNQTSSGLDANANDILDLAEVTSTTYVCNGATGAAGADGTNGANGLSTLIAIIAEPPSANCTYGGNKTSSGLDANANAILDFAEVTSTTYVCNGAPGSTGATGATGTAGADGANGLSTLIAIIAEPPSANCTYGGNKTSSGLDANANGTLDLAEVASTTYVCNGAPGATGAAGVDGADGLSTLIAIIAEPPSANCTYGGNKTSSGLDANANTILDLAEITSTTYVCNGATGADGTNGLNTLIAVIAEPPSSNCTYGGNKTTSGLDANANGILDLAEVTSTTYVCNGATGATGAAGTAGTDGTNGLSTLIAIIAEPPPANCTYGGNKISSGLDANASGVLDPGEVTSTTYVCNGATGATGAAGANGTNGLNTLVAVIAEPPSSNCTYGGNKTTSGLDANANGILDLAEVSSTTYVCNGATGATGATGSTGAAGADGTNGLSTLIAIVAEPPSANCTYGGNKTTSGLDTNLNGILDPGEVSSASYVCNGATGATGASGADGVNGLSTLISIVAEPPSANCTYGGNQTSSGLDADLDGILDPAEVTSTTYVCSGATGATGAAGTDGANGLSTLISIVAEPPSANCTFGGSKTSSGLDANSNGILDLAEVSSTTYVCNGATGATGAAGTDGANGLSTLIAINAEPPSANCTYGGNKTTSGLDANLNSTLDPAEVTSTTYVCNGATGATGANGLNTLVAVIAEPPSANCTYGGNKTTSGLDANTNGVLDSGEVTSTTYVCNGAPGAAGTGLTAYGYIYNLSAQVVAVGAAVTFDNIGVLAGITSPNTFTIQVTSSGIYDIWFSLSGTEANQFALFVNGSVAPGSIYASGAGTQQNTGRIIITLVAGDLITLVNYSSAAAVTLATPIGGTQANVNAAIVIQKLD